MGHMSLKVLDKHLNFSFIRGYEPCSTVNLNPENPEGLKYYRNVDLVFSTSDCIFP